MYIHVVRVHVHVPYKYTLYIYMYMYNYVLHIDFNYNYTHVHVILYHSTQFHVFETSRTLVRLVLSQTVFIITVY